MRTQFVALSVGYDGSTCKKYVWLTVLLTVLLTAPVYAQGPAAPSPFQAQGGNAVVNLSWSPVTGLDPTVATYMINRSTAQGSGYAVIATVPSSQATYQDTGLTNGNTYYYTIASNNGTSQGTASTPALPAIPKDMPIAPPDLTGVGGMSYDLANGLSGLVPSVTLYWTRATYHNETALSQTQVLRFDPGSNQYKPIYTAGETATSFVDTGFANNGAKLQDGTPYLYEVVGVNDTGTGPPSSPVIATPGQASQPPLNLSPTP